MKIVIIGSNGQLGSDLMLQFSQSNNVIGLTHDQIEIAEEASVNTVLSAYKPDVVINTAAFHNLPVCESNPAKSFNINSVGAFNLARTCSHLGAVLVHYSTDYVFDGEKQLPYFESDIPNPLNIYGASKLSGEHLIKTYMEKFYIIRVSGIYGRVPCRAKGGNFIYNIVKASKEKPELKVVSDEILTPTPTAAIAYNTFMLLNKGNYGIYHMTCEGQCSWYEFTKSIFEKLNILTPLFPSSAKDSPAGIKRPYYSVLENKNLSSCGLNLMPEWDNALSKFLKENF
jgi:dTDP-4-dehydrorhamnose reductase